MDTVVDMDGFGCLRMAVDGCGRLADGVIHGRQVTQWVDQQYTATMLSPSVVSYCS